MTPIADLDAFAISVRLGAAILAGAVNWLEEMIGRRSDARSKLLETQNPPPR